MFFIPVVFIISFIAFIYKSWIFCRYGNVQSRRLITGYEIARHILDGNRLGHMIIDVAQASATGCFSDARKFYLKKKISEGKSAGCIASAAFDATLMIQLQDKAVSFSLKKNFWKGMHLLILAAWLLLILSFGGDFFIGLRVIALFVFAAVLFGAVLDLAFQWDVVERACYFLKHSNYFEIDETVQLKKLLRALRWENIAIIFDTPLFWLWNCR